MSTAIIAAMVSNRDFDRRQISGQTALGQFLLSRFRNTQELSPLEAVYKKIVELPQRAPLRPAPLM
jgi:hypothetical protein